MSTQIWGLRNCDTCRKALKALPDAQLRDVRQAPLTPGEIDELVARFPDKILNTASTTWRALPEVERAKPPAELLAHHPALMKRPVIHAGDTVHLGWTPAVRAALGVT